MQRGSLVAVSILSGVFLLLTLGSKTLPHTFTRPLLYRNQLLSYLEAPTWYKENPYLGEDFDFVDAAKTLLNFRRHMAQEIFLRREDKEWDVFNLSPSSTACKSLTPLGIDGPMGAEEAKYVCNPEALTAGCVVYSVGSNNQYEFENSILRSTPCEVHTFDCSVKPDLSLKDPRIIFHEWCLGSPGQPPPFKSLVEIMETLGHESVDLLKLDIEGHEYPVIEALYRGHLDALEENFESEELGGDLSLPLQICVEFHWKTYDQATLPWSNWMHMRPDAPGSGLRKGELASTWVQLSDMGFVVAHREDNPTCPWCSEFTLVRAFRV